MKNIIITKELYENRLQHPDGTVLDCNNINKCVNYLNILEKKEILIYDIVYNNKYVSFIIK